MKSEAKPAGERRRGGRAAVIVVAVIVFMFLLSIGMLLKPTRNVKLDEAVTVRLR